MTRKQRYDYHHLKSTLNINISYDIDVILTIVYLHTWPQIKQKVFQNTRWYSCYLYFYEHLSQMTLIIIPHLNFYYKRNKTF